MDFIKSRLELKAIENEERHDEEERAVDSILTEGAIVDNDQNSDLNEQTTQKVIEKSINNETENNIHTNDDDCQYVSAIHYINLVSDDEEYDDAKPSILLIRNKSSLKDNNEDDANVEVETDSIDENAIIISDEDVDEGNDEKNEIVKCKPNAAEEQETKSDNESNSESYPTKVIWQQVINEKNLQNINENLKRDIKTQKKIAELFETIDMPNTDAPMLSNTEIKSESNSSPAITNPNSENNSDDNSDNNSEKSSYSDENNSQKNGAENCSSDSESESGELTDDDIDEKPENIDNDERASTPKKARIVA